MRQISSRLVGIVIAAAIIVIGISAVIAQQVPFPDGRINQFSHYGGDALYCVDRVYQVTGDLPNVVNQGGFRLLNQRGQGLWYIPGADVTTASERIKNGNPELIATGQGSYGPTSLYVNISADGLVFLFSGFDEHGKPNSFVFGSCGPQDKTPSFWSGPTSEATSAPTATGTLAPTATSTATNTPEPTATFTATNTPEPTATNTQEPLR